MKIQPLAPPQPIGVIDSGIGGLSVLRQLISQLPQESWLYVADSAYQPYGEKTADFIYQRCCEIVTFLLQRHQIKMLIIACNTATAVAIAQLRNKFPTLPIIGLEPAIKPALTLSRNGRILTLATYRTINSAKFHSLLSRLRRQSGQTIDCIACNVLAAAIEDYVSVENAANLGKVKQTLASYLTATAATYDTLVLGCTHYPLVKRIISQFLPPKTMVIDSAPYIVNRCRHLLRSLALITPATDARPAVFYTSGAVAKLQQAARFTLAPSTSAAAQFLTFGNS